MHITKLSATNVRGVTGSWDIGPAVMIIGDNFRGKSAVLHAVRLAVFGWLPHPRKESEMKPMSLASGDEMLVGAEFSDGRHVGRKWVRDKKGSVSGWTEPNELSNSEIAPAIMLDPKQYFDASPAKRMKFVFDSIRLPESDFSMHSVLAEVKNIKLEQNTEATEKALQVVTSTFLEAIAAAESEAASIQDFVDAIIGTCTEKQKLAKQAVDRMSKTVAGLTELELKKPEQFDDEIGEVDAALVAKREEVAKWNSERGRIDGELKTVTQRMEQRRRAEATIANEPQVLKELAELEAKHKSAMDALNIPTKDFTAEKSALVARRTKAKQDHDAILARIATLKDEISAAREAIANAHNAMATGSQMMKEVDAEMAKDLNSECCPTCDAPGQEWKERVKQKYGAMMLIYSDSHAGAQDTAVRLGATRKELEQKLATEQESAKAADAAVTAIESEQRALVEAESKVTLERQQLASTAREAELKAKTLEQSKSSIGEARQYLDGAPAVTDRELKDSLIAAGHKLNALNGDVSALDQKRTQIVAQKANASSQIQAVRERDKAQAELDIWKETIKVVTTFQRKMVDAAFGSMMQVANRFSDGILDSPLEYRDGEVGRSRDGRWVPQDQFSDAEQIVTYAAMSIALAASAPFRIVIVDELTRVRGLRKQDIVMRMMELIEEGVIDQFVAVDTETDDGQVPDYYKLDNLDIIHIK